MDKHDGLGLRVGQDFPAKGLDDDGGRHRNLHDIESDNGRMELGDVFGGVCENGRFALRRQLKFDKAGHIQGGVQNGELFRPVQNLENVGKTTHLLRGGRDAEKKAIPDQVSHGKKQELARREFCRPDELDLISKRQKVVIKKNLWESKREMAATASKRIDAVNLTNESNNGPLMKRSMSTSWRTVSVKASSAATEEDMELVCVPTSFELEGPDTALCCHWECVIFAKAFGELADVNDEIGIRVMANSRE
ncbi:hypothetical protein B0H17DRAFT_1185949 [Mycena rosella]|uniref:Uncharacterized protein n=1 Tax=Mycena rosella TaxID=1033263 RepID=A0AAD7G0Z8_MYCRO|nr:hypothetical protein B0H17DRAFT_1185949 [Mycena rosella]